MSNPHKPVAPRLEAKSTLVPFCGCKLWFGASVPAGYGNISVNGRLLRTHRVAWELVNGPIPQGLHVLHACDMPACINVAHLFLGTATDNMRDMVAKGRGGQYINRGCIKSHRLHGSSCPISGVNINAKLTAAQAAEIRAAYKRGVTRQVDIAGRFGVTQTQVSKIIRGESWAI